MNEFGEFLKKLRGKKSIREVAKDIGISHTYLSTLEKGFDPRTKKERNPTPDVLEKLSNYYNVPYIELMRMAGYLPPNHQESITIEQFRRGDFNSDKETYVLITTKHKVAVTDIRNYEDEEGTDCFSVRSYTPEEYEELQKLPYSLDWLLENEKNLYYKNKILDDEKREQLKKVFKALLD